jgi:hypothetical protein
MKIDLPNISDGFRIINGYFCQQFATLVTPALEPKWTKHNLHLRSVIVNDNNEVISIGFPKFFNCMGVNEFEKPDCYPNPSDFRDWKIRNKADGTLVICNYHNDQFSMRTRGTFNYQTQENFQDFDLLPKRYPELVMWLKANPNHSVLVELITPNNIIVVPTSTVEFYLLDIISHDTLETIGLDYVEGLADDIGIPVPKTYDFNNLEDLIGKVKDWENSEGVVISYNKGKNRVKVKCSWYLIRHRLKSELNSENKFIELYVSLNMPNYQDFFAEIVKLTDYETAVAFQGRISNTVEAGKQVKKIVEHMKEFVRELEGYSTRKEKAEMIINSYGGEKNNRAGMAFKLLDGKELNSDDYTKLMWQILKD